MPGHGLHAGSTPHVSSSSNYRPRENSDIVETEFNNNIFVNMLGDTLNFVSQATPLATPTRNIYKYIYIDIYIDIYRLNFNDVTCGFFS